MIILQLQNNCLNRYLVEFGLIMTNFALLQYGNKLVKKLRDENAQLYDFLNQGEPVDGSMIVDVGFAYPLDYCGGSDGRYHLSDIKAYCDDFTSEYNQDDWDWDFGYECWAYDNLVSNAKARMADNHEKMQAFYALKGRIVLACGKPIAVHQSAHTKEHISVTGYDDDGNPDYDSFQAHDYYVLFDCDGYSFHLPYDDVMDKWGDDFLNELPKGEVGLISATLPDDTPYAHLSLDDVLEQLSK